LGELIALAVLGEKFREVVMSVFPVVVIVLVLSVTVVPLEPVVLTRFLVGALFIIIGLSIFLFGAEIGVAAIGNHMGSAIANSNKLWIVGAAGLGLGFLISICEPDLHILAGQVSKVTSGVISKASLVAYVSLGIAVFLAAGFLRIIKNVALRWVFIASYLIIFGLALFSSPEFVAIAFDSSGATTGAMTVPFMLALGLGVSSLRGIASEEDSFGLVGIASAGAIVPVLLMSVLSPSAKVSGSLPPAGAENGSILAPFAAAFPLAMRDIGISLFPLALLFWIFQVRYLKLSRRPLSRILKGLVYTFVGLTLFLAGVNAGFMDVGSIVGYVLASFENKWIVVLAGLFFGLAVVLAEPAVHVLVRQIEDVTSGYLTGKVVFPALSLGVGLSVALSALRIVVPGIKLWHYLLPGWALATGLSLCVPNLFVGMAFDSGGVASGPMTATFILAFAQGAAEAIEGADVMVEGFGVIAMVALTPVIALQVLGLLYAKKSVKEAEPGGTECREEV
jgi:hypothetical protein